MPSLRLTMLVVCCLILTLPGHATAGKVSGAIAGAEPASLQLVKLGDNVPIVTSPAAYRYDPAPAYNSTENDYMVVWRDGRGGLSGDIFAQRVTAEGSPTGPNIAVWVKEDAQMDPVIAYNSADNQYLVVWNTQEDGYFSGARGRRLDAAGLPLGTTDKGILLAGLEVAVVHNSSSLEYFVTGRDSPGSGEIHAQRVSHYMNLVNSVITVAPGARYPGEAAYDPDNNRYLMVYRNLTSGSEGVEGRFILSDGTVWGVPFSIASEYPQTPQVAYDSVNGRFLVVFRSVTTTSLRGQLVSYNGNLIGDIFTIHSSPNSDANPDVTYSPTKRAYVVVWRNASEMILAKAVSAAGEVGHEFLVVSAGTSTGAAKIAYNSLEDEFLITWADDRNVGPPNQEIFAQLISFPKQQTFVADDR
jgi:hypothetical protein